MGVLIPQHHCAITTGSEAHGGSTQQYFGSTFLQLEEEEPPLSTSIYANLHTWNNYKRPSLMHKIHCFVKYAS